ncbi:hypothetical protein AB0O75_12325 [Streptomyces sp. NPDC088921]
MSRYSACRSVHGRQLSDLPDIAAAEKATKPRALRLVGNGTQ